MLYIHMYHNPVHVSKKVHFNDIICTLSVVIWIRLQEMTIFQKCHEAIDKLVLVKKEMQRGNMVYRCKEIQYKGMEKLQV